MYEHWIDTVTLIGLLKEAECMSDIAIGVVAWVSNCLVVGVKDNAKKWKEAFNIEKEGNKGNDLNELI